MPKGCKLASLYGNISFRSYVFSFGYNRAGNVWWCILREICQTNTCSFHTKQQNLANVFSVSYFNNIRFWRVRGSCMFLAGSVVER